MMNDRCYSELIRLKTFEERFKYLKLEDGHVGEDTFGSLRYINQRFYSCDSWKRLRRDIILRDFGCDLGLEEYPIYGKVIIHHMNPIGTEDIISHSMYAIDPEYLICVSLATHNAIHYGSFDSLCVDPIERFPNDTCPWK